MPFADVVYHSQSNSNLRRTADSVVVVAARFSISISISYKQRADCISSQQVLVMDGASAKQKRDPNVQMKTIGNR